MQSLSISFSDCLGKARYSSVGQCTTSTLSAIRLSPYEWSGIGRAQALPETDLNAAYTLLRTDIPKRQRVQPARLAHSGGSGMSVQRSECDDFRVSTGTLSFMVILNCTRSCNHIHVGAHMATVQATCKTVGHKSKEAVLQMRPLMFNCQGRPLCTHLGLRRYQSAVR